MADTTKADDAVVADMLKSQDAARAGRPFADLLAEEMPEAPTQQVAPTGDDITLVYPANDAIIAARPAELVGPAPRPGLTERGWSPEVTARHPQLLADEMAAMVAEMDAAGDAEPIDPTDAAALTRAQRDLGMAQVRIDNLRMEASQRLSDRLAAGLERAAQAAPAVRAALNEAVDRAQAAAERAQATVEQHRESRAEHRAEHPPRTPSTPTPTPPTRPRPTE